MVSRENLVVCMFEAFFPQRTIFESPRYLRVRTQFIMGRRSRSPSESRGRGGKSRGRDRDRGGRRFTPTKRINPTEEVEPIPWLSH